MMTNLGLPVDSNKRHQAAAMALKRARELELQEHGANDRDWQAREPDEIVDADRGRAKEHNDALALVLIRLAPRARRHRVLRLPRGKIQGALEDRAQRRNDVAGLGHRGCALLEEIVRP